LARFHPGMGMRVHGRTFQAPVELFPVGEASRLDQHRG
jgi:hypothetical protein